MSGPFDVQVPGWLQQRAIMQTKSNADFSALGTALVGGINALTEDDTSYTQGYQEARMTEKDPMWPLKVKQGESQIQDARTSTTAKWLGYDQKIKQAKAQEDSMAALQNYDGSKEVPAGVTDIHVLALANKRRSDWMTAQLKTQKQENDFQMAKARLDNQSESLGIRQDKVDLETQRLEMNKDQFNRKLEAQTSMETIRQQGRIDLEKLKALDRTNAQGMPLTKLQFINRHLNTVFKDLQTNNQDSKKPVTIRDAQQVLSDAYDSLPQEKTDDNSPTIQSGRFKVTPIR